MAILVKPIITEKSIQDANLSRFTFAVLLTATKTQIKAEVEELFNVHVLSIQTVITHGRTKQVRIGRGRKEKLVTEIKKAIITLKKGETISYFEQKA